MKFSIRLQAIDLHTVIPINYQYPLSSALYRIIAKGDAQYAAFLHEKGYGKGFKYFTFSQLHAPFRLKGDRLQLLSDTVKLEVSFHLPIAAENFIKGLFQSQQIEIADKKSKAAFTIQSVESLPDSLVPYKENEIISVLLKPLSPLVAGLHNDGNYDFLSPEDSRFGESIIYNWRSKIAACYDENTAQSALLLAEVLPMEKPFKSRLITIKAGTKEETKIRGWLYLFLKVTAEKRFVELLLNAGAGVYNAMGMGCCEVVM